MLVVHAGAIFRGVSKEARVIELLGVGTDAPHGPWIIRGVCAAFEGGELTFVVASDRAARVALLDVVSARRIPTEGRAWVSGKPLMRDTAKTVAAFVGRVDLRSAIVEGRTVLASVLPDGPWWSRVTRSPTESGRATTGRESAIQTLDRVGLAACANQPVATLDAWRRRRLAVARAMIPRRDHLVAPEVDENLSLAEAADVLGVLRTIAHSTRVPVIVSAEDPTLVHLFADRVLVLADGVLTFDGPPQALGARATPTPRVVARAG